MFSLEDSELFLIDYTSTNAYYCVNIFKQFKNLLCTYFLG